MKYKLYKNRNNLSKKTFLNFKESLIEKCLNKKKYIQILNDLEKIKYEVWAPPPKIEFINQINTKVNQFIEENTLKIFVTLINNETENLLVIIKLDIENETKILGPINDNLFNQDISFQLKKEDFLNVYSKKIKIELYEKNLFFKNRKIDEFDIELSPLANNNELEMIKK